MPDKMNVLLAQLRPALRNTSRNLETVRKILAGSGDVDLVVFPELFLSGYTTSKPEELAQDLEGSEMDAIARLATETSTAVILGAPERAPAGIANSAISVDRYGNIMGTYRKTHLFGSERDAYVAGNELLIVDLDGVRAGIMICFDVEFPEVARALVKAGANLLVTISANMDPFGRDHDVFATARALENGVPHLYVNQVGRGEAFTFAGGTMIVSADGDRLAEAGAAKEKVVRHQLDLSARSVERPEDLRPDYLQEMRGPLPVVFARRARDRSRMS
ncbi:MAG TPA: nitrilase-related carbon-nitrogen hydrolase [Beijerinckiaceae bacterium]|nr:nitrilase-related carbon-nitrogen hydrolase [Beijerinckiaceae bacterium]